MSTNQKTSQQLERLVKTAIRCVAKGDFDQARSLYTRVCETIPSDSAELFQVTRSWVNLGVLFDREDDSLAASNAWLTAWKVSRAELALGDSRAAGFQGLIFRTLRSPKDRRADLIAPAVREALGQGWPEPLVWVWNLFAGAPGGILGECAPADSGIHEQVSNLALWSNLFFSDETKSMFEPSLMPDFERFYRALRPDLRPFLWKNPSTKLFCQRLFSSSMAPFPAAEFELQGKIPAPLRSISWVTEAPALGGGSPVRGVEGWGSGWTWVHEDGGVWIQADSDPATLVLSVSGQVTSSVLVGTRWHLLLDQTHEWVRGDLVTQKIGQSLGDWQGIVSGVEGCWAWTRLGEVFWWPCDQESPVKVADAGEGPWGVGFSSPLWGLVLGSRSGRLWRYLNEKIEEAPAHGGPITALLGNQDLLLSAGEDGLALVWSASQGLGHSIDRKSLPGPVRLAAKHGQVYALAGSDYSYLWDERLWTLGPAITKPTAVGIGPGGELLVAETKGRITVSQSEIWGWSEWVTHFRSHPTRNECAITGLDGSIRVLGFDSLNLVARGKEPVLDWLSWDHGVVGVGPFRLEYFGTTGRQLLIDQAQQSVWTAWTCRDQHFFLGSWSGELFVIETGSHRSDCIARLSSPIVSIQVIDDEICCATRAGMFYRLAKLDHVWKVSAEFSWGRGLVAGANWSKSGLVLAWGQDGHPLLVLDSLGRPLTVFEPSKGLSASWWDGDLVWIAEGNGRLAVWNARSASLVQTLVEEGEKIRHLVLGKRNLIVVFEGRRLGLIQLGGISQLSMLGAHRKRVTTAVLANNGNEIWTSSADGTVRRFRLPEGEPLGKFEIPREVVDQMCFFDDGIHFALGTTTGKVVIGGLD